MDYKEKLSIVKRKNMSIINVNRYLGGESSEASWFEKMLRRKGFARKETKKTGYHLISTKKKDIEEMSDKDVEWIRDHIKSWTEIKASIIRDMNRRKGENEERYTWEHQPTTKELREFSKKKKDFKDVFEDNSWIIYGVLDTTDWYSLHDHSIEEIEEMVEKVKKEDSKKYKDMTEKDRKEFTEEMHKRAKKAGYKYKTVKI